MDTAKKKERNFPNLDLKTTTTTNNTEQTSLFAQESNPVLIIQSPKTPTLSRKQKAASLDSDDKKPCLNEFNSAPNTPKKQQKSGSESGEIGQEFQQKLMLTPNLKRFASNQSISGSQTLKTLPEIMTLQEFTSNKHEPVRIKAKGLLERRGSNASLTIDLGMGGSTSNLVAKPRPHVKLNPAKSVSNLNLSSFGFEKFKNSSEKCGNCTIYESVPSKTSKNHDLCKCNLKFLPKYYIERHCVCNIKFRRKSLSNENLYVPPCNFCHFGSKDCFLRTCNKGSRKALYPRQTYIETSQLLSEDFKLHLQNVQYLQTAGSVLSVAELKQCCQMDKIPRLHQEFWEVPLNLQEKCLVSGSQSRNRYKGVLPNEHSRVILPGAQPYIHANYIKGPDYTETLYIATQGPMTHTCEDFWSMVWAENVHKIVMLTALVERGRNKCALYFPLGLEGEAQNVLFSDGVGHHGMCDVNQGSKFVYDEEFIIKNEATNTFGPFQVHFRNKNNLNKCVVRELLLVKSDEPAGRATNEPHGASTAERLVQHYWFPNWADHKLANPEQVLRIALHVLDFDCVRRPVLVHCSAGIGRTGCFLAILNGIQQLRSNFNVDVLAIVCSLRLNRGGMVQTAEQYELIHRVLSLYADTYVLNK